MKGKVQFVGVGEGYDAGVGGESRVSSVGAERWSLWERNARRRLGTAKTEEPMVGDGENEGGPERRSRRNASVYGVIPGAG